MHLIFRLQAAEDRDRSFYRWFLDLYRLEPSLESCILSDRFPILVGYMVFMVFRERTSETQRDLTCGGPDELQATCKGRFNHLTCIYATLRLPKVKQCI